MELSGLNKTSDGDRKVKKSPFLLEVSGGEVYREFSVLCAGGRESRISNSRVNALLGLLYGLIGKANDRKRVYTGRGIDLNFYQMCINAFDGGGEDMMGHVLGKRRPPPPKMSAL
jgi:hypothetical protein